MTAADLLAALELPPQARIDQRVAKKLLVENGAVTSADKRRINEGIEELAWVAALKPTTIGVPVYRDEQREYLEIAVLSLGLRPGGQAARLAALVHRAIPYPVLLIATQAQSLGFSAAHKRRSQSEAGKIVLDEAVVEAGLPSGAAPLPDLPPLSLAAQPRTSLFELYQGWVECIEAISAGRITGRGASIVDRAAVAARRQALADHARLTREIALLRSRAERQSQLPRRVELNLQIKRLEAALAAAKRRL